MANATAGTVLVVDTTGYVGIGPVTISAVKYIGAAAGTASIKADGSGGVTVWEQSGTANVLDYFEARVSDIFVSVAAGVKVYIYFCAE